LIVTSDTLIDALKHTQKRDFSSMSPFTSKTIHWKWMITDLMLFKTFIFSFTRNTTVNMNEYDTHELSKTTNKMLEMCVYIYSICMFLTWEEGRPLNATKLFAIFMTPVRDYFSFVTGCIIILEVAILADLTVYS